MKHILINENHAITFEFKNDFCLVSIVKDSKKLTKVLTPAQIQEVKDLFVWKGEKK